jgi:2-keto-3-deoxy-L-rhamnonate aldolase RhmA
MSKTHRLRQSIVHQRLAENLPVYCFKSNIPHPMVPEMIALAGAHCLWFDSEHLATTTETMTLLVQAARGANADTVVRVKNGEYGAAARMLDNGATGIMYPQVREPEDVARLVEQTRFAPVGRRGADFGIAAALWGMVPLAEVHRYQNEQVKLLIQIETPESVACIDEIASVPGISMLFIGPGDLSLTMGLPIDPEAPHILDVMQRTADAAQKHGLHWGMPALSLDHAARILSMGGRFLAQGGDTSVLLKAVKEMRAEMAEIAQTYGGLD